MKNQTKYIFWIYSFLNVCALTVVFFFFGEAFYSSYMPIADVGLPIGMFILAFLVPLGCFLAWLIYRKNKSGMPKSNIVYLRISQIFLTLVWFPSFLFASFVILFFLYIFQPWPISLHQGPDTRFAKEKFEKKIWTSTVFC